MVRYNPLAKITTLTGLARHMFKDDSHYCVILGKNKSGKTTTAFNLAERVHSLGELGFSGFGANVQGVKCPFDLDFIEDLETLKEVVASHNGKYLFIFDEMGKNLPKRRFMAKLNIALLSEMQVIRKGKLSMIGIAIGDSVDRELLKPYYLNSYIQKGSRYTKTKMAYYDLDLEAVREFTNLKKCQTKFQEYSIANFSLHRITKIHDLTGDKEKILLRRAHGETFDSLGLQSIQFWRIYNELIPRLLEKAK